MSKGLEALEKIGETFGIKKMSVYKDIEKELKALEIIKNKQVDAYAVVESKSLEEMNNRFWFPNEELKLTQEEYDLLKEVFL